MTAHDLKPGTTSAADKGARWDKILPLLLVLILAALLFRPLLWGDVLALRTATAVQNQDAAATAAHADVVRGAWTNLAADAFCFAFVCVSLGIVVTGRMGTIAINTFREAVRNRILYFILFFAVILIVSSGIVKELAIGAHERMILDLGLACINFFGLMVAIFVGISLVYNEIEKKTIYTIVSKPLHRHQFLLGKYFGLLMTVYVIIAIMAFCFLAVLNYQRLTSDDVLDKVLYSITPEGGYLPVAHLGWIKAKFLLAAAAKSIGLGLGDLFGFTSSAMTSRILAVVGMTSLEMMIITAFAVFYSSFTTPTLTAVFTVMTFLAGRLNEDIMRLGLNLTEKAMKAAGVTAMADLPAAAQMKFYLIQAVAVFVPNLDSLNIASRMVNLDGFAPWRLATIYAPCYTASILMLAILIFRKRNFK